MDQDAESQPTEHDKEFIKMYKLIHIANDKAAYTASKTLNSRLSEPEVKEYIKELYKNFVKMSEVMKKFRDKIANVDSGVVLNNHRTYPNYFHLLSSENQRKIEAFERSLDAFEESYKMVKDLNKLNKSTSPRSPRSPRTPPTSHPRRSTRVRVGGRRKKRRTRNKKRNH